MRLPEVCFSHNELWVIDGDARDPWFTHFDYLTQFSLSRHRALDGEDKPYLVFCEKFLPARQLLMLDLKSPESLQAFHKSWAGLGSPATTLFISSPPGSADQAKLPFAEFTRIDENKISLVAGHPHE